MNKKELNTEEIKQMLDRLKEAKNSLDDCFSRGIGTIHHLGAIVGIDKESINSCLDNVSQLVEWKTHEEIVRLKTIRNVEELITNRSDIGDADSLLLFRSSIEKFISALVINIAKLKASIGELGVAHANREIEHKKRVEKALRGEVDLCTDNPFGNKRRGRPHRGNSPNAYPEDYIFAHCMIRKTKQATDFEDVAEELNGQGGSAHNVKKIYQKWRKYFNQDTEGMTKSEEDAYWERVKADCISIVEFDRESRKLTKAREKIITSKMPDKDKYKGLDELDKQSKELNKRPRTRKRYMMKPYSIRPSLLKVDADS